MLKLLALLFTIFTTAEAHASLDAPPPNVTALTEAVAAIQATMPQPASVAPAAESLASSIGVSTNHFALADHQHPRLTRATVATTVVGGTFSVTWADPFSAPPGVILTPVGAGSAMVDCQLTADPTTTAVAGKCFTSQGTVLNLGIITAGLTLNPAVAVAAGVKVHVVALPPTQP